MTVGRGINVASKKTPCMDCEDRRAGCHAGCEAYKKYREVREDVYQKRLEKKTLSDGFKDVFRRTRNGR